MAYNRLFSTARIFGLMALAGVAGCASTGAFQGWTPEQLFQYGEESMEQEEWGDAGDAFERLVTTFPAFERSVDARHLLAQTFFQSGDYLSAVSEYTRLVQVYPDDPQTRVAWMGLCRSYGALAPHPQRDQQYTLQARTTCQNVSNDFSGSAVGDSARVEAMAMESRLAERVYAEGHFYFQRDVLESAEMVFLELLSVYRETPSAPMAAARLIDIYSEWEWDDQLEAHRAILFERYPDSPAAQEAALLVAVDTVSTSKHQP